VGVFEVPADWDTSKMQSYLKAYKKKNPSVFQKLNEGKIPWVSTLIPGIENPAQIPLCSDLK